MIEKKVEQLELFREVELYKEARSIYNSMLTAGALISFAEAAHSFPGTPPGYQSDIVDGIRLRLVELQNRFRRVAGEYIATNEPNQNMSRLILHVDDVFG
jgi:hypothetical protein